MIEVESAVKTNGGEREDETQRERMRVKAKQKEKVLEGSENSRQFF